MYPVHLQRGFQTGLVLVLSILYLSCLSHAAQSALIRIQMLYEHGTVAAVPSSCCQMQAEIVSSICPTAWARLLCHVTKEIKIAAQLNCKKGGLQIGVNVKSMCPNIENEYRH
ncbi:hypothetical protein HDV64DRAFT_124431 [Trichoderma sp. TUCIM 5745]